MDTSKHFFQAAWVMPPSGRCCAGGCGAARCWRFLPSSRQLLSGWRPCAASHYWARELCKLGHEVKLIAPQHVKAYIKRNKNDGRDAEGLCEAMSRPDDCSSSR